jgi:hypothetical protein
MGRMKNEPTAVQTGHCCIPQTVFGKNGAKALPTLVYCAFIMTAVPGGVQQSEARFRKVLDGDSGKRVTEFQEKKLTPLAMGQIERAGELLQRGLCSAREAKQLARAKAREKKYVFGAGHSRGHLGQAGAGQIVPNFWAKISRPVTNTE